jgi:hypothetical protein
MRQRIEKRFYFTQLSAVLVGTGALLLALYLVVPLSRLFGLAPGGLADVPVLLGLCLFIAAMVVVVPTVFYAWRLLLVRLNLLSRSEANGYPYSKPWER